MGGTVADMIRDANLAIKDAGSPSDHFREAAQMGSRAMLIWPGAETRQICPACRGSAAAARMHPGRAGTGLSGGRPPPSAQECKSKAVCKHRQNIGEL